MPRPRFSLRPTPIVIESRRRKALSSATSTSRRSSSTSACSLVDAAWVWLQTFQLWNVQVNVALWADDDCATGVAHALGGARAAPGDRLRARPARALPRPRAIYKRELSTALASNRVLLTEDPYGGGIDLGFNFYNGDYTEGGAAGAARQVRARVAKLGLREGSASSTAAAGWATGCTGSGDEKKCTVVGVNVILAHALVVRGRGMRCIHSDWQTLFRDDAQFDELRGQVRGAQFDARAILLAQFGAAQFGAPGSEERLAHPNLSSSTTVTFWDTIEHYCKASEITVANGLVRSDGKAIAARGDEEGTANAVAPRRRCIAA